MNAGLTDLVDFFGDGSIPKNGMAQLFPVGAAAAGDDVVDRGEGEALMIEVTVDHPWKG